MNLKKIKQEASIFYFYIFLFFVTVTTFFFSLHKWFILFKIHLELKARKE